jgi:hypothetical protein
MGNGVVFCSVELPSLAYDAVIANYHVALMVTCLAFFCDGRRNVDFGSISQPRCQIPLIIDRIVPTPRKLARRMTRTPTAAIRPHDLLKGAGSHSNWYALPGCSIRRDPKIRQIL